MSCDTPQSLSRSALRFFSGTMLSRLTGLARDMSMAFCFGTSPALAAFLLTYRFVYLIRRLFGEGMLHQGFIPYFEAKRREDPKKGACFFRDLFLSLACLLGGLIFLAEIVLFFCDNEMAKLAMWMLPGIFFICLFGLSTGLLQSEKMFFLPSVAPVAFNVIWIIGVFGLKNYPISQAVVGLSIVISFAFVAQWFMTVPKVWTFLRASLSIKELFKGSLFSAELKALARPLVLGMIGVAAVQVNSAIDGIFARFANSEGPAYLWYAIRIQQLPLALFGLAISSALLPSLSRAMEEGASERFEALLNFAKKRLFLLIFPCVVGIFVLGVCGVNLLYGRGGFGSKSIYQTVLCLWCYGIGLLPSAFVQIFAQAFYAKKDYRTPSMGFLYASLINIGLNALLVFYFHLGAPAIALSTSFATIFNALFLKFKVGSKIKTQSNAKVISCTLLSAGISLFVGYFFLGDATLNLWKGVPSFPNTLNAQILQFSLQTGLYFFLVFSFCRLAKVGEATQLVKGIN